MKRGLRVVIKGLYPNISKEKLAEVVEYAVVLMRMGRTMDRAVEESIEFHRNNSFTI